MVTFVLKSPNSPTPSLIYLLAHFGGRRLKFSTGQSIDPRQWNKAKHRARKEAKGGAMLNAYLDRLEAKVKEIHLKLITEVGKVTPERIRRELELAIASRGQRENLVDFAVRYAEASKSTEATKKIYTTTINHLRRFPGHKDFDDIDAGWLDKYVAWMERRGYAANYIGRHVTYIKIFLANAVEQGVTKNEAWRSRRFKKPAEEVKKIYLTENELLTMYGIELPPYLDRVRDRFMLGAFTGLRFSDFSRLSLNNVHGGMISDRNQKTGERVVIPVHWVVRQILEKYKDLGGLPPAISNQKMNVYLKLIGTRAGIEQPIVEHRTKGGLRTQQAFHKWELICTHTARRSAATNMYLAGIPAISIMRITGHKTERSFMRYINISQEENAMLISSNLFYQHPAGGDKI